jgi:polysaccharide export outer membrane protein
VFLDFARRYLRLVLVICAAASLAGCAGTRGGPIPYDRQLSAPDAPTVVAVEAGYKIAPMDKLAIKVFRMDDMSGDYDVDLAGHISLPLIGELDAANMTTAELDDALTRKLGEKYLENPDVSVALKQSVGRMVTLDGAVREPGSYPVLRSLTLIQAVAMAKGVTEDSNPRRVAVFRTINGKRQAAAFDLVDIRRGQAADPAIYAGDIIVVDGSAIKELQKQLLQGLPILSIFSPL